MKPITHSIQHLAVMRTAARHPIDLERRQCRLLGGDHASITRIIPHLRNEKLAAHPVSGPHPATLAAPHHTD
jgi:hypothetical protein